MNDRIRELMVELKKTVSTHRGAAVLIGYDEIEKFSELIVVECIGILNRRFTGDLNREDMEVRRCIDDVKKHFGVTK